MSRRTQGIFLLVAAFIILGFVAYKNSAKRQVPIVFSPPGMLAAIWNNYKNTYLEVGTGRVLDKQKNYITTSEGESYAMLRAVWMDDKQTFDTSWQWTKDNMRRGDNGLVSWLFGKLPNGSYGILVNQGGVNTATDADTDIALALIFASGRWNEGSYLGDARVIINSIWNNEIAFVQGKPYVVSNNIEKNAPNRMIINPSYLAPYAYRIFAKIDTSHPWMDVVDTSYDVINKSLDLPLDTNRSAGIPPDWISIDKNTGAIFPPSENGQTTNMSFDALRVPWRLALDWQWFNDSRAKNTLAKMQFLSTQWKDNNIIYTNYTHDGKPAMMSQSAAFYGGAIGYFIVNDPTVAQSVYENKLQILFNPDTDSWKVPLGYYDDNWAWFGIALYNNLLPNLVAQDLK